MNNPKQDRLAVENLIRKMPLRGDREYVTSKLRRYPVKFWREIMDQYIVEYKRGVEEEEAQVRKSNAGRRRANLWLLSYNK